jgi:hypothetical protein
LALTELFNATGGPTWTSKAGWPTAANLNDWDGVSTDGVRVTAVELPNNNMEGNVPRSFADISGLITVNFATNELRSFPDMSKITGITTLNLASNRLVFKDIVPNLNVTGFAYRPQRRFGETKNLKLDAGTDVFINDFELTNFGAGSTYQWHFGPFIPGKEFNNDVLPIDGATSKTYILENIDINSQGTYRLLVNHPQISDFTIESRNQNILAQTAFFGRVLVDGALVTEAEVLVWRQTLAGPFVKEDSALVNIDGEYRFEDVALGTLVVVAKPDREIPAYENTIQTYYISAETYDEADRLLLEGVVTGVDIDLLTFQRFPPGNATISGIMESEFEDGVDEEGNRVSARRKVKKAACAMRRFKAQGRDEDDHVEEEIAYYVETDDDGFFNFADVADGKYLLNIEFPGVPIDPNAQVEFEIGGDRENQVFDVNVLITEAGIEVSQEEILYNLKPFIKDVMIYPNPTEGVMGIDYLVYRDIDDLKLQLISTQGVLLMEQELEHWPGARHTEIDLTDYSVGVYYLIFTDNAGTFANHIKIGRR